MTDSIPRFNDLLTAAKTLVTRYQEERANMDKARILANKRPVTKNPDRIKAATFIENLANIIDSKKYVYQMEIDTTLREKPYLDVVLNNFLRPALAGAFLLELIQINNAYKSEKSVKSRSALAKIILILFRVNKLSDIDPSDIIECLKQLNQVLEKFEIAKVQTEKWRGDTENALLREHIEEVICDCYASLPQSSYSFS